MTDKAKNILLLTIASVLFLSMVGYCVYCQYYIYRDRIETEERVRQNLLIIEEELRIIRQENPNMDSVTYKQLIDKIDKKI